MSMKFLEAQRAGRPQCRDVDLPVFTGATELSRNSDCSPSLNCWQEPGRTPGMRDSWAAQQLGTAGVTYSWNKVSVGSQV